MEIKDCEIGIVGLGVMGGNLLLNAADRGFAVAGYEPKAEKIAALRAKWAGHKVRCESDPEAFVAALRKPRVMMLLVPAGEPVDSVIATFSPLLSKGDIIIDGGNSHFTDTARRGAELAEKGINFFGAGVSGGAEGARHGPSLMPGGPKEAYERVRPVLEAIAAKAGGEPCTAYLGPGASGHFVKMTHNGIEYALMELLAESYDLMKRGLGMDNDAMARMFAAWDEGPTAGFLTSITGKILARGDEKTGGSLIDVIQDVAKQKGTGMWTSQAAMELRVPVPCIDTAVAMRDMSAYKEEREAAAGIFTGPAGPLPEEREPFLRGLHEAFGTAMIAAYAQGMHLLRAASDKYNYGLDLGTVARIWRGGCIIRSALLEDILGAYRARPGLPNLLLDQGLAMKVKKGQKALRRLVSLAAEAGIPAPGFMAALGYLDAYRSRRLPANLVSAQRDFFGSHTYERVDAEGSFHTEWEKN